MQKDIKYVYTANIVTYQGKVIFGDLLFVELGLQGPGSQFVQTQAQNATSGVVQSVGKPAAGSIENTQKYCLNPKSYQIHLA